MKQIFQVFCYWLDCKFFCEIIHNILISVGVVPSHLKLEYNLRIFWMCAGNSWSQWIISLEKSASISMLGPKCINVTRNEPSRYSMTLLCSNSWFNYGIRLYYSKIKVKKCQFSHNFICFKGLPQFLVRYKSCRRES